MNTDKSGSANNDTEQKTQLKEIPFQDLAPIDTVSDETTFKALDFALNQSNIKNIAVTGTYGSGKSSILRSYEKKHTKKWWQIWKMFTKTYSFLNISLATFVIEETPECLAERNGEQTTNTKKELIPETTLQKIEKSILQQIFYKKSGRDLPYSRFTRIRNLGKFGTLLTLFVLFTVILFPIKFFLPEKLNLFKNMLLMRESGIHGWFVAWAFTFAIFCILYFMTRLLNKIKINKIGFQNADISLDASNEHSLLNKYLDEVLYFFEVTDFNVIVIEDLDRFKNTEVFIKLRELNTLINNYDNVKRKIVFIYALRDEVFCDSSRTKFFEFIIPVIPIINNQNSGNILFETKKKNMNSALQFLEDTFLFDVSLYIDDMRLLINCINEFRIYDEKINIGATNDKAHDRNKILALIIYKNLYPKDFAELSFNKGFLFGIFERKNTVVNESVAEFKKEIEEMQETVERQREQFTKNIEQLRTLYVAEILKISTANYTNAKVHNYITNTEFEKIRKGTQIIIQYYQSYNTQSENIVYKFADIEKIIDQKQTYQEKVELLQRKTDDLQENISEMENEIKTIMNKSIAQLLSNNEMAEKIILKSEKMDMNTDFIAYLLRSGKIAEDYFDYISYFYEGKLSRNDKDYLLLIKNFQKPIFDMPLNKVENVIKQIRDNEWNQPSILNNTLLIGLLNTENEKTTNFISTMYEHDRRIKNNQFFKQFICDDNFAIFWYTQIFETLQQKTAFLTVLFNDTNTQQFYDYFLFVDVPPIFNEYKQYICNNTTFLYRVIPSNEEKKIIEKLVLHNIAFDFTDDITKYPIFASLVNNNLYHITNKNLTLILKFYNKDIQTEITDFLTQIIKLDKKEIKDFIETNISYAVKNILLPLGEQLSENEEVFIELLNSDELDSISKFELIMNNKELITDITEVKTEDIAEEENETEETENSDTETNSNSDLWELLVTYKKIQPTWANIVEYFKHCKNTFDDSILHFLSDTKIIEQLALKEPLTKEEIKDKNGNNEAISIFYSKILGNTKISTATFKKLMGICPWVYKNLSNYDIAEEKMNYLVVKDKLTFTQENYKGIKDNFKLPNIHIREDLFLLFLHKKFKDIIKNETEQFLKIDDVLLLLQSSLLSIQQKKTLIETGLNVWKNLIEETDLFFIGKIILDTACTVQLKHIPLVTILISTYRKDKKIAQKILFLQFSNIIGEDLIQLFDAWGGVFKELITKNGKKTRLEDTEEHVELCHKLLERKLIASFKKKNGKIEIYQKRK